SSRRRHTRWPRDWSSDVCSSDLLANALFEIKLRVARNLAGEITSNAKFDFEERVREAVRSIGYVNGDCIFHADTCRVICEMSERSEERRVGKGWEAGGGRADERR